jgi:hypothetical protein
VGFASSKTEEQEMSIFGNIMSAIFGPKTAGSSAAAPAGSAPGAGPAASTPGVAAGKPMTRAEVEATIEKLSQGQREDLNWRQSIVDLMKLLKLDSSLDARKQLAQELGYTGALNGSAEMNTWLHRQVMTKLAESGGVVPDSLKRA